MPEKAPIMNSSELSNYLARKIAGQPNAQELIPFVQTYKAGLNHANRPAGVFLLLGPTGTGKTRTVEVLAEALHGDPQRYLRIDCGEFQLDHEVAKLIGAPPGYLGHKESIPLLSKQKLADTVSAQCDLSLILMDEIEKAAPSLGQLLLGVLDKGRLTLGDSSVVNFENCLIFFTSNLGAREMMREMSPGFGFQAQAKGQEPWDKIASKLENIAVTAVRKKFSPEFVNRIDAVITYRPLTPEAIEKVLDNQIEELREHVNHRLGAGSFSINLSQQTRDFLLKRGVSVEYGARELKRAVYRYLTQPLATLVAEDGIAAGSTVAVNVNAKSDSLEFDVQGVPAHVETVYSQSILIVDDNKSLLKFLKAVMKREGWDAADAGSAEAALQLAKKRRFDVALIDYMLPDLDGAALGIKLKAHIPDLKIVLMTGGGAMSFPQTSLLAGVPILQKPFPVEDALQLIKSKLPRDFAGSTASATTA